MIRGFLIFVLLPFLANAQIVVTARGSYNNTANAATYTSSTFTPTANSLLVAMVAVTGSVTATPTMTGGSLTWTRQASSVSPSGNGNGYHIFWAKVGATPASTAPIYNGTGDSGTGCQIIVIEFVGYNRDNPIRQTKFSAVTTTTNPNITFDTNLRSENAYFIAWGGNVNTALSTQPSGWVEQTDAGYNTPTYKFSGATKIGGVSNSGPIAFSNAASTTWITMGVEINVAYKGLPSTFF